jgi:HEAT repeat protein
MRMHSLFVALFLAVSSPSFAEEKPVEKLISLLGEGKKEVNDEIVRRGEVAVKPLAKVLQDEKADWQIRIDAALLLGRIGGRKVVGPLKSALADQNVQFFVVIALKSVGPDASEALEDLVKMLQERAKDDNLSLGRRQLIEAVGSIGYGSEDAANALALCMKDKRDDNAAQALARLGAPGAEMLVSLAVKYASDARPYEDRRYSEAYGVLSGGTPLPKETIPVFKKHLLKGGRDATLARLGFACVGPPAIPVLKKLLDDKNADVRACAAEALATMNFHAQAARRYRQEKVADPVSSDEFFPKLRKLYKLPDGDVDFRIIHAMIGIDYDRVMSDPEMVRALREELIKELKKQPEKQK